MRRQAGSRRPTVLAAETGARAVRLWASPGTATEADVIALIELAGVRAEFGNSGVTIARSSLPDVEAAAEVKNLRLVLVGPWSI